MDGRECALVVVSGATDDVAHVQPSLTELDADTAAAHVGPQANAARVSVPKAERVCAGAHTVGVRQCIAGRGEVPWHDAIGYEAAPFEIAVAPLPRVAEQET